MPNSNAASINLQFASFVANNNPFPTNGTAPGGPYCVTNSLAFAKDRSGNNQDASGQVLIDTTSMKVTVKRTPGNNAAIQITFNVSCADGVVSTVDRCCFVQAAGSGDPGGSTNFPNINSANQSLTIIDTMASVKANGVTPRWNFYLQIHRTVAGIQTAWIDPDIENEA